MSLAQHGLPPAQSSCRNSSSRIPCLLPAHCFHLSIFSCGSWGLCTLPEEEGPWTLFKGSFHSGCSAWALGLGSAFSRELCRSFGMSKERPMNHRQRSRETKTAVDGGTWFWTQWEKPHKGNNVTRENRWSPWSQLLLSPASSRGMSRMGRGRGVLQ